MIRIWALGLCLCLPLGCGLQDDAKPGAIPEWARTDSQPSPDGTRVIVPEHDASPPAATIALADAVVGRTLAKASWPGRAPSGELELKEPRLRGTTVGEDVDGGILRVRVSVSERVSCRSDNGARFQRLRARYFPPPQIEQIRAAPGARLSTRGVRSRLVLLALERCGAGAKATEVDGKLWGEVINGHGLETITPAIRFRYRR